MSAARRRKAPAAPVPSYKGFQPASEAASRVKRANRKKDTRHELLLRQALWALGLRYRKHAAHLPGNPDLVFAQARVVVFCDGSFWHGQDWPRLRAQLARRHNAAYWLAKIARNRARDRQNNLLLQKQGWRVLRLWENDIKKDPVAAAERVRALVQAGWEEQKRAGRRPLACRGGSSAAQ